MKKRLFAAFVCLCIIVSQLPTITFAEAGVQDSCVITGTSGLCEHHTKHDESCGYTEGTAEIPCSHEHTESCGGLTDPTACNHTHDEACSYVPATEGSPCTFVCEVCNAQNSDDQEVPSDPQPEKCSCETLCTEEEVNTGCPICSADHISCTGEAPVFQTPVCTCTNKCSEGTMKTDCSVCSADGVDLSVCKGTVSMLLSVSRNVENIPYLDENGRQQTAASAKTITDQDTVWDGGTEEAWYVVDSNVTIGSRIIVTGTVHLILADGYTLTASQGIQVAEGNSLIIYAQSTGEKMGALTVKTQSYNPNAGIGGSDGQDGGTVTINGGTVNVSSYYGAGIGGDYGYDGTVTITITGGTVTAKSIDDDSIGKGVDSTLSCTLTIGPVMGGQITAKAGGSEDDAQPLIGSPLQNETQAIEQENEKKYFHSEMQKFTTITSQPQSVTVTEGGTATFEVAADGTGTLTYQWQQSTDNGTSWTNINGANAASYTTSATTIDMNGYQYRCMVTGDLGNATSAVVSLTVKHNLVKVGAKAATCTENGNLEYWYCEKCDKHFKDENGATPTTFEDTVIKATGHSYENGNCTVCGEKDPNYVKPTENAKSPQTGENNSISLLLIFALISTVVFMIGKKQKTQKK